MSAYLLSGYQDEIPKSLQMDYVDATTTYIGRALAGSALSDSVWQILKMVSSSGDIDIRYADSGNFSQIWNNRASLSYP